MALNQTDITLLNNMNMIAQQEGLGNHISEAIGNSNVQSGGEYQQIYSNTLTLKISSEQRFVIPIENIPKNFTKIFITSENITTDDVNYAEGLFMFMIDGKYVGNLPVSPNINSYMQSELIQDYTFSAQYTPVIPLSVESKQNNIIELDKRVSRQISKTTVQDEFKKNIVIMYQCLNAEGGKPFDVNLTIFVK